MKILFIFSMVVVALFCLLVHADEVRIEHKELPSPDNFAPQAPPESPPGASSEGTPVAAFSGDANVAYRKKKYANTYRHHRYMGDAPEAGEYVNPAAASSDSDNNDDDEDGVRAAWVPWSPFGPFGAFGGPFGGFGRF